MASVSSNSLSSVSQYPGCLLCKSIPFATQTELISHWLDGGHQERLRATWGDEPVATSNCVLVHTKLCVEQAWNVEKILEMFETKSSMGGGGDNWDNEHKISVSHVKNFVWWPDRRRSCIIEFKMWENADDFHLWWMNKVFVDVEGETVFFKQAQDLHHLEWLAHFPDKVAEKLDNHSNWNTHKREEYAVRKRALEYDRGGDPGGSANDEVGIPTKVSKTSLSSEDTNEENSVRGRDSPVELLEELAKDRKWEVPEYFISPVGKRRKRSSPATYFCKVLVNGEELARDTICATEAEAKCHIAGKAVKKILEEVEPSDGGDISHEQNPRSLSLRPSVASAHQKPLQPLAVQKPQNSSRCQRLTNPHNSHNIPTHSPTMENSLEPSRNQMLQEPNSSIQRPSSSTASQSSGSQQRSRNPLEPSKRQIPAVIPTTTPKAPSVLRTRQNSECTQSPILNSTAASRNHTNVSSSSPSSAVSNCPLEQLEKLTENRSWLPPQYFLTVIGKYGDKFTKTYKYFCTVLVNGVEWARDTVCATEYEAKRHIARKALQRISESVPSPATSIPGASNLNSIQVVPAPLPPQDSEDDDFWWKIESENWGDNVSPLSSCSSTSSQSPQEEEQTGGNNTNGTSGKTEVPEDSESWVDNDDQLFTCVDASTSPIKDALEQTQESPSPPPHCTDVTLSDNSLSSPSPSSSCSPDKSLNCTINK